MPYKYLEKLSLADVAFEATAKTLAQLIEQAALATTNTMVKDLKSVSPKVTKRLRLRESTAEKLLFSFLEELIYLKDAELLLFSKFEIGVKEGKEGYELAAVCKGEKLDMKKHELLVDVKAVTMHHYEVKETKKGWFARVILDI
jgi:SHS2 domain-containing protein